MKVKVKFHQLQNDHFSFEAISFVPEDIKSYAIFTHGYTSSKGSIFSWGQRLSEAGIATIIFDIPGHYLGSINEVESFDDFKNHAHECFVDAYHKLLSVSENNNDKKIFLGGHSLGALLSIKALELDIFNDAYAIGVGLGISQHKETHLFESSFYEKTLNIRRQLVSPSLDSDHVFPWIKNEKLSFSLRGKKIHLITGADDVVVGKGGMEALSFLLNNLSNEVSSNEPKKLPHHEPGFAASHVYHFIKKELTL